MDGANEVFLKKLQEAFRVEASENIQKITEGLLALEKNPDDAERAHVIEAIYRVAHTLKGAARAVEENKIEQICQEMESEFSEYKTGKKPLKLEQLDNLHQEVDAIKRLLGNATLETSSSKSRAPSAPPVAIKKEEYSTLGESVRIPLPKIDGLFRQAEEMLTVMRILDQHTIDLRDVYNILSQWRKSEAKSRADFLSKQENITHKENSPQLRAWMEGNESIIKLLEGRLNALSSQMEVDRYSSNMLISTLLEDTKKLLMLPFSTLLNLFPKMVRDLSRDQKKTIELDIQGAEIEIDKRILEEIKEALIHIVRNAIDHGIGTPEERKKHKKSPAGHLQIKVVQIGASEVSITIADDGQGIDVERVKAATIKQKIITEEEVKKLDESALLDFIYHSGVSTSPILTEVSGRGLGMAIVREKIDKIGGKITLKTSPGAGTSLQITLPLKLATFKGVLIKVQDELFVVPIVNVERVIRVHKNDVKTIENKESIVVDDHPLSFVRLENILENLENKKNKEEGDYYSVFIIASSGKRIAFKADAILYEQEILAKNLMAPLKRVRNIGGATVLGTGKVIPILDASDLIHSAIKEHTVSTVLMEDDRKTVERKPILVVEDSITTRMLLKNILELAGYTVTTAVDGVDAFSSLQSTDFSIVISDVEMPRMNGFELTKKIRNDKKFATLPVVLVTALESQADKEHGIDVGADAYIIKSNFDSGHLLDVIERLT